MYSRRLRTILDYCERKITRKVLEVETLGTREGARGGLAEGGRRSGTNIFVARRGYIPSLDTSSQCSHARSSRRLEAPSCGTRMSPLRPTN